MDIDEFLEEKEQKSAQEILEKDRPFFEKMMAEIKQKKQKSQRRKKIVGRWAGVCAGVAAAFVCVFVPAYCSLQNKTVQPYSGYAKNKIVEISDWSEGSKVFNFSLVGGHTPKRMELTYDVETGDDLYYFLEYVYNNDISSVYSEIIFYPNPYYEFQNIDLVEGINVELNGLTLVYAESTYIEGDVIYSYETLGKIEQGDEVIYFQYSETTLNSQSGFVEFVQEFVQKK